jgi:hypothetical protein
VRDLFILEAVGDRGVRITSWLNIRGELYAGGFFDKVATRKLCFEMTPERLGDLDQFRKACVGHKYGLSPTRILFTTKSKPTIGGEDGRNKHVEIEKGRQFFCSELVAKAFKVLQVLKNPDQKGCSNYYPGSFAPLYQGGSGVIDAELKDDVALGPVSNIMVNPGTKLDKD